MCELCDEWMSQLWESGVGYECACEVDSGIECGERNKGGGGGVVGGYCVLPSM